MTYVKDNFDYTLYRGAQKGSEGTMLEWAGNDYDQAALLIALLRASGVPARFVRGTMDMETDDFLNWIGVNNLDAATQLYQQWQSLPLEVIDKGRKVRIERVWVEAFLRHEKKPRWVAMDPAFKHYLYSRVYDASIARSMQFDKMKYLMLPSSDRRTGAEVFRDKLVQYLEDNPMFVKAAPADESSDSHPGDDRRDGKATIAKGDEASYERDTLRPVELFDLKRFREIDRTRSPGRGRDEAEKAKFLHQHQRLVGERDVIERFSTLNENHLYRIGLHVINNAGIAAEVTLNLADIYLQRLTLSYPPATEADHNLVAQHGGYYKVPADRLRVRPVIKVAGRIVAEGNLAVSIGDWHALAVDFIVPGLGVTSWAYHGTYAGGYYAIGLNSEGRAADYLKDRTHARHAGYSYDDEEIGERLSTSVLQYLDDVEVNTTEAAELVNSKYTSRVSEAMAMATIRIFYKDGVAYFRPSGFIVDAPHIADWWFSADGDERDHDKRHDISGTTASSLEHLLWEDMTAIPSISSIKGMRVAHEQGIPIYRFNAANIDALLPTMNVPYIVSFIRWVVDNGGEVIVPRDTFRYHRWQGIVLIADKPSVGFYYYMISGGYSGGATTDELPGDALCPAYCNPNENAVKAALGDRRYLALALKENAGYLQFDKNGLPYTSGKDVGMLQINSWWANNDKLDINGDGRKDVIDYTRVQTDWQYNVDVGKAIFDDASKTAQAFFKRNGVTPTTEQLLKETYFQHNHSPGFRDPSGKWVAYNYYEIKNHVITPSGVTNAVVTAKDYSADPRFDAKKQGDAMQSQRNANNYYEIYTP